MFTKCGIQSSVSWSSARTQHFPPKQTIDWVESSNPISPRKSKTFSFVPHNTVFCFPMHFKSSGKHDGSDCFSTSGCINHRKPLRIYLGGHPANTESIVTFSLPVNGASRDSVIMSRRSAESVCTTILYDLRPTWATIFDVVFAPLLSSIRRFDIKSRLRHCPFGTLASSSIFLRN